MESHDLTRIEKGCLGLVHPVVEEVYWFKDCWFVGYLMQEVLEQIPDLCPAGCIVDGQLAVDEGQEPAQTILQMSAHLTVVLLCLETPDVVLQSFPLSQGIHHKTCKLFLFVAAEVPLETEPLYLPKVVSEQYCVIILLIPIFERDDSKLYWEVDAVNSVESAVLEIVGLALERDVPIQIVLVGDRIQQFLAARELLCQCGGVVLAVFEFEEVVVEF